MVHCSWNSSTTLCTIRLVYDPNECMSKVPSLLNSVSSELVIVEDGGVGVVCVFDT